MKIKICGITDLYDAQLAEAEGADYLGFIFYQKSPRYIDFKEAKNIIKYLHSAKPIGVFVDCSSEVVKQAVKDLSLYAVQIYQDLPLNLADVKKIRAIPVQNSQSLTELASPVDYFLLDTYHEEKLGGTGESFDWNLLPKDLSQVFLSGGIGMDNIARAQTLNPYAIDVCSRLEQYPGRKDAKQLKIFMREVRSWN